MADQEYNLKYTSDNSDILAKTNVVIRALMLLASVVDRLLPKLQALFSGAGRSANTAATNFGKAAAAITAVPPAAKGAASNVQALADATRGVSTGTNRAATSMGGLAAQMLAMRVGREVFHEILDLSKQLEAHWDKMAAEASQFRDSLRELASLKGQEGPNNDVMADVLTLGLKAGMVGDKARQFAESYENLGPTVRAKKHYQPAQGSEEDLEQDILGETARTARRLKIGEDAAGLGMASAGMHHTFRTKEDAMEQFGTAMKGLSEGSVNYTQGLQYLNVAAAGMVDADAAKAEGSKPGTIGSFGEAGVYMGVESLHTGKKAAPAAHMMVQTSRALNPAADYQDGLPAKALRAAGVEGLAAPDQVIRLSKYLKEQNIANPAKWLEDNKIGTQATRLVVLKNLMTADVLEQRIKAARESAKTNATGKATIAANERYMATDRTASAAQIDAIEDAQNKSEGVEGPEEFRKAKRYAEARRKIQDPLAPYDQANNLAESDSILNPFGWLSYLESGVSVRGNEQENNPRYGAIPYLKKEAARVGADISRYLPGLASGNLKARGDAFTKASEAVKAKGGDPLGMREVTAGADRRVDATRGDDRASRASRGGGGALDPEAKQIQKDQLKELQKLNAKVGGGPKPAVPAKPLPVDVDDAGPTR